MSSVVTQMDIRDGLLALGVKSGMAVEVHCSLSSFGHVEGGANTLIEALMQAVGSEGAIVMPSFRLSDRLPLDDIDRELGLTCKIRILEGNEERTGMGIVSDTFRKLPQVITGQGIFRVSAWGKDAALHSTGLQRLIDTGGRALLFGVDIYRLSSMHYMEDNLPEQITSIFKPSDRARALYPEDQWFIEAGEPPVKAWYKIQTLAYEMGMIRGGVIGDCKCMFFRVADVVGLYRRALQDDPLGLYGLR